MRVLLLIVLLAALASSGRAAPQWTPPLSEETRVSVLTVLPGDAIHALFGHTALRVHDPASGLDAVFNYGTFDFSDPLFVPRFAYGQMDYFLSVHDFRRAVDHYRDRERRPVIEQELNLTLEEIEQMYRFLRINALPDNRVYRYDFFFDNCSTRPRDVIEDVLGSRLQYGEIRDDGQTFRQLLAPYVEPQPFLRAGIDLLLGSPTDRPATARETMFLPLDLFEMMESASVVRDLGLEPLVVRTDTVAWVEGYASPRATLPWATLTMTVLLLIGVWLTVREARSGKPARSLFDALVLALVGVAGIVILFMWVVSEHTVTAPNWNLYWAWPTHLVAAYLIQRGRSTNILRPYLALTAVATAVFAVFWFAWPQVLPIALLPLAILVALRSAALWMRYRRDAAGVAA